MEIKSTFIPLAVAGIGCLPASPATAQKTAEKTQKPNVLFIIMDDMCDWQHYLGGNNQVITPNLDRLASRGVWFSNAYTAVPLSNPSRTAMMTGLQPFVTGIYNNEQQLQGAPKVESALMMPRHFRDNGYTTLWAGKIFHNKPSPEANALMWDDMTCFDGGYGPRVFDSPLPEGVRGDQWQDYEEWTGPDTDFSDVVNSQKVIDFIGQKHDKPFFAAMGFYRPHTPYTAPKRYFDMYDVSAIRRPEVRADDLDDVPQYALDHFVVENRRRLFERFTTTDNCWEQIIRAYLACVTFADDRLGMILDALDRSPYARNTIVVLVGDNGFHHGEKERFGKSALWREACHVPFIVSYPGGKRGTSCVSPVSLIDIYPTLVSMCGLPKVDALMGNDLDPLLKNPKATWDKPCISTFLPGNFVVHKGDWNYLRYADGSEELYNVKSDENEFVNVAKNPENAAVVKELAAFMPAKWHPGVKPSKVAGKPRIVFKGK